MGRLSDDKHLREFASGIVDASPNRLKLEGRHL